MKAIISFSISEFNSIGTKEIKFKEQQSSEETFKVSCEFVLYAQHKPTCFACGEFNKEINQCEICGQSYCEKHKSNFSIHNQIDFNCCEECQINRKQEE